MEPSAPGTEQTVLVVGAGLAGAMLGLLLARMNDDAGRSRFRVRVFEKRGDFRAKPAGPSSASIHGAVENPLRRSINLALSHRGKEALRAVGLLDTVMEETVPMHGRVIHDRRGELSFQPYGDPGDYISSVSREQLLVVLLRAIEELPNVEVVFNKKLVSCTREGTAKFVSSDDAGGDLAGAAGPVEVRADLVVGADGAFSRVRGAMLRGTRVNFSRQFLGHSYKELTIHPDREADDFQLKMPHGLHIWPRETFMLIALPNMDKSFTLTLFAPNDDLRALDASQARGDTKPVLDFFRTNFPDALAAIGETDLLEQFRENPTSSLLTIRVQPWSVGRMLLIGDAAHAVVPFFGQGMNAAFEDGLLLSEALQESKWDLGRAAAQFALARKESADGLADLSLENYEEMRSHTASSLFVLERTIERMIHSVAPHWWIPRYTMVTFTRMPYSEARDRAHRQEASLAFLGMAAVAVAAAAAVGGAAWWVHRRGLLCL